MAGKYLVEETKSGQKAYDTLLVDNPKLLSALSNDLVMRIIKELSKQPLCAMDVARKLKEHEQKIYYHMRRLEKLGVIKLDGVEERVGALAKIYSPTSPVISFKLFEGETHHDIKSRTTHIKFLKPFVENGKLNALVIVGSPDPHGKYRSPASDGYATINLGAFLGQYLKEIPLPFYKLDTQVTEKDLKNNLIILGGPKANMIMEKINKKLPIYFDYSEENLDWNIVSTLSKNTYREKYYGMIVRTKNPFAEDKEILIFAGKGFTGSRTAILAFTQHLDEVIKGNQTNNHIIARVVKGIDMDSDGIVDEVEFVE